MVNIMMFIFSSHCIVNASLPFLFFIDFIFSLHFVDSFSLFHKAQLYKGFEKAHLACRSYDATSFTV